MREKFLFFVWYSNCQWNSVKLIKFINVEYFTNKNTVFCEYKTVALNIWMVATKEMRLPEIFGLSTFPVFRHCETFDGLLTVAMIFEFSFDRRKRPEFSSFLFRESRLNYAKFNRTSKLLPERTALVATRKTG